MESYKLTGINLEVAKKDIINHTMNVVNKKIDEMGEGWRLPTIEELFYLYKLSTEIGVLNLQGNIYWSSSVPAEGVATDRWTINFNTGSKVEYNKFNTFCAKLVRDL